MSNQIKKWVRWIDSIQKEVQELVIAKYMFSEVRNMIISNPALQDSNSYYDYLANSYASHAIMGIRRQIKVGTNSISLVQMFDEMIKAPDVLNRVYYCSLFKGSVIEDLADGFFDKYAGVGKPHIEADMVHSDRIILKEAALKCEDYADRRVAHTDTRKVKEPPTFDEVDACVDQLETLCIKYLGLLTATQSETLLPTWQYDWKSIFRTPWLQDFR